MERFKFRLERLLSLKRSYERMKMEEISVVKGEISRIEDEKRKKIIEMIEEEEKFRRDMNQVHMILHRLRYIGDLKDNVDELEMRRRKMEEILEEKVREFLELQREKKIYERLKERKYREYVLRFEREAMNFLDDISLRKHHFTSNEGER
ncbi:MAG: hypothetical protein DRP30_02265 [Thermotoga sp.]|nr:MAG: hypothetical protein DRP30_02265 [Thermotoga sp.]